LKFFAIGVTAEALRIIFSLPGLKAYIGATYVCIFASLEFGKRVVDFLLVIVEYFSLGVTAEAIRTNVD